MDERNDEPWTRKDLLQRQANWLKVGELVLKAGELVLRAFDLVVKLVGKVVLLHLIKVVAAVAIVFLPTCGARNQRINDSAPAGAPDAGPAGKPAAASPAGTAPTSPAPTATAPARSGGVTTTRHGRHAHPAKPAPAIETTPASPEPAVVVKAVTEPVDTRTTLPRPEVEPWR